MPTSWSAPLRGACAAEPRAPTTNSVRIALYRALGFTEIAPYYDTPVAGTVFMSLAL